MQCAARILQNPVLASVQWYLSNRYLPDHHIRNYSSWKHGSLFYQQKQKTLQLCTITSMECITKASEKQLVLSESTEKKGFWGATTTMSDLSRAVPGRTPLLQTVSPHTWAVAHKLTCGTATLVQEPDTAGCNISNNKWSHSQTMGWWCGSETQQTRQVRGCTVPDTAMVEPNSKPERQWGFELHLPKFRITLAA